MLGKVCKDGGSLPLEEEECVKQFTVRFSVTMTRVVSHTAVCARLDHTANGHPNAAEWSQIAVKISVKWGADTPSHRDHLTQP